MSIRSRIEWTWLSLKLIAHAGIQRERTISHSAKLTAQRWKAATSHMPTDGELTRLIYQVRLFEQAHGHRPNEHETDTIIQHVLQFPSEG